MKQPSTDESQSTEAGAKDDKRAQMNEGTQS
jgi:hypothetical protein